MEWNSNATPAPQVRVEIISHLDYNNGLWILIFVSHEKMLLRGPGMVWFLCIMIFAPDSWGFPYIQGALKLLMEGHLHAMFRLECSLEDPHPEKAEKGRTGVLGLKELLSFYNDESH